MKFINHTIKKHIYNIENTKINKKIIVFSDVHISTKFIFEKLEIIKKYLIKEKPDYICIPGDLIDSTNVLKEESISNRILTFLNEISKISPVIISVGNHDNYILTQKGFRCEADYDENINWFNKINEIENVHLLDNEIFLENNICFCGFTVDHNCYVDERQKENEFVEELKNKLQKPTGLYNVLLCHSPLNVLNKNSLEKTNVKEYNLILSGHMHNGVTPPILDEILPGNKGIFSPDDTWLFNTKLCRGKYSIDNHDLIISGGITKIHDCSPNYLIPLNELFPMAIDIINLK